MMYLDGMVSAGRYMNVDESERVVVPQSKNL